MLAAHSNNLADVDFGLLLEGSQAEGILAGE